MSEPSSPVKPILGGCLIVVAVIVLVFGLSWLAFGYNVRTAGIFGRGHAEMTVQAAPYRLAAYNHFFDACSSIQSTEGAINEQFAALDRATTADQQNRANTNLSANQTLRIQAINQYNADAAKEATEGQFRDSGLPYRINPAPYQRNGVVTSCGA